MASAVQGSGINMEWLGFVPSPFICKGEGTGEGLLDASSNTKGIGAECDSACRIHLCRPACTLTRRASAVPKSAAAGEVGSGLLPGAGAGLGDNPPRRLYRQPGAFQRPDAALLQ